MRRHWAGCLIVTLAGGAALAAGPELRWQPAPAPSAAPTVTLGPPVVSLGAPRPVRPVARGQSPDDGVRMSQWAAALSEPDSNAGVLPAIAPLQLPPPATPASATVEYPSAPPPLPPAPPVADASGSAGSADFKDDPLNSPGSYRRTKAKKSERRAGRERTSYFGEWIEGWVDGFGPGCFESDHCFDNFISPMTNPFLFEDPRALTEARPIFTYQTIPGSNPVFRGGHAEFFGTQLRLAVTDRWSLVINKLGGVSINPGDGAAVADGTGFAEFWLGPKYTIVRNTDTCTLAAAGITFQIPTGPDKVFQDTGKLSVVPYASVAQNFGHTQYGSFNVMDTLGYSFRADGQRSDYFFNSLHLDFDVGNLHRFYPLLELNWFHYSRSGTARDFGTEGRDLANIGSTGVSGHDNLTIAPGFRYKFSEGLQTGIAVEFPLNGTRDLLDFRLGVDVIFRY